MLASPPRGGAGLGFIPLYAAIPALIPFVLAVSSVQDDGSSSGAREAAHGDLDDKDLVDMSIEDIFNVEVEITRNASDLSSTPAAVYVLYGDEIRRSGHTSVQEALRMVPGFQVSRFDNDGWSVTARGFSGGFANNLLVMVDGVSVYTPLFAGVWWHLQEIDIDDIERIEIIRGPGASLWGANAVNGIVNVITKSAADTQGHKVHLRVGAEQRRGSWRWGDALGNGHYRVWVLGSDHDAMVDALGDGSGEDWYNVKGGFRGDWMLDNGDELSFLGQGWYVEIDQSYFVGFPDASFITVEDATPKTGLSMLGRWKRTDDDGDSTKVSAFYTRDHYKQVDFFPTLDIWDIDFQRFHSWGTHYDWLWGFGYRLVQSDIQGDFTLTSIPTRRNSQTFRGYLMNYLHNAENTVELVFGASLERNDFTRWEFQPTARLRWNPSDTETVWLAASSAVRTPSLEEHDLRLNIPLAPFTFFAFHENHDLEEERLHSYEVGYRFLPRENMTADITAFYNKYDNVQTIEDDFGNPFVENGGVYFPLFFDNKAESEAYGIEFATDIQITDRWKMRGAYTLFEIQSEIDADSTDIFFSETDESTPRTQFNLRSYLDLTEEWELDSGFYFVDTVPFTGNRSYFRGDLRVGYNPSDNLRFSLGVQNAFEDQHAEEGEGIIGSGSEVERNVYASITWSP